MRRLICFISILYTMLTLMATNAAAIDPASLVKVTPNNNIRCVEYYTYKGELYCSATAQSAEPIDPQIKQYEKLKIIFDDRPWQMAWGKKDPAGSTIEYVPNGEDINNWNELITSQAFPRLQEKFTPKQFAEKFIQNLTDSGYKPIVTFLKDSNDQVIFEFRIEQPENQIQDELQMITKDNKNLYVLHYAIKQADMGQKNRDKWLQNLKNSHP